MIDRIAGVVHWYLNREDPKMMLSTPGPIMSNMQACKGVVARRSSIAVTFSFAWSLLTEICCKLLDTMETMATTTPRMVGRNLISSIDLQLIIFLCKLIRPRILQFISETYTTPTPVRTTAMHINLVLDMEDFIIAHSKTALTGMIANFESCVCDMNAE